MNNDPKIIAFDYFVYKLQQWFYRRNSLGTENDLSKLKVIKLLFFTVAISANRDEDGLLTTFDNFVALPYGHVESDIYERMHTSDYFIIDKQGLSSKADFNIEAINTRPALKSQIDKAISNLEVVNKELISYKAFDLVDISHKWNSWKTMYQLARKSGRYSMKIPNEMIKTELKTFIL
jgi:uncharacterized phage-associated protein